MTIDLISLTVIAAIAVVAPLIAKLVPHNYLPETVILLAAGAIAGPHLFGWFQQDDAIKLFSELGLAFLFLFAGFEIEPRTLFDRQGRRGIITWVICFGIALGVVLILAQFSALDFNEAAVAIALSTTALGTLLPILQERKLIDTRLGSMVIAYGTWGELCPIIAMALLLSARSMWLTVAVLIAFGAVAVIIGFGTRHLNRGNSALKRMFLENRHGNSQVLVRLVIMTLLLLVTVSSLFALDIVLGAFAAGFVLRFTLPEGSEQLENKLRAISYGFFVPVFFVVSGASIDIGGVFQEPNVLVGFVLMLLFVRGIPIFVALSTDRDTRSMTTTSRVSVALYCTTALPLIVAVTAVAVGSGTMSAQTQSVLICAGAFTVLAMPLLAALTFRVTDAQPLVAIKRIKENPKAARSIMRDHLALADKAAAARSASSTGVVGRSAVGAGAPDVRIVKTDAGRDVSTNAGATNKHEQS